MGSFERGLNDVFPVLERLSGIDKVKPTAYIHHFPHLVEVVEFEFFRLNPQISHLRLTHCNWKLLTAINESLSSLQHFQTKTFSGGYLDGNEISFPQLKNFSVLHIEHIDEPKEVPLSFGNLELFFDESSQKGLFTRLKRNKHLKKLYIAKFDFAELQQITQELSSVEHFGMRSVDTVERANELVEFIKTNEQFKVIEIRSCIYRVYIFEKIRNAYEMIVEYGQVKFIRREL